MVSKVGKVVSWSEKDVWIGYESSVRECVVSGMSLVVCILGEDKDKYKAWKSGG